MVEALYPLNNDDNICFDITSLGYYEVLYLCNVSQ